ncbi:hypothetical protein AAFF_G00197270 [Aldrovandia affinis]|uniref:Breakpoint cluster region protein n=1 Tax=Aldrovandia affinis TaxID=143900 RepID=A0AAD7RIL4_9TELE|nr:hypothetical protein AAFF_G00197270 [Aldrovandia affinis]
MVHADEDLMWSSTNFFMMLLLYNTFSKQVMFLRVLFDSQRRLRNIRRNLDGNLKRSRDEYDSARLRRWRRFMRLKATAFITGVQQRRGLERKMWKLQRPHGQLFWSSVLNNFDEEQWREHFRMSRNTFEYVLQLVEATLRRKTTRWRKPIEPQRRLAIVLWWYATPSEYRTISCLFGVGVSTVCKLVRQVTSALKTTLLKRFICLPKGDRLQDTLEGFADRGYPMCAGAIDATHIPIIAPKEDHTAYYNRKGWHSIVLQAVVDHKFCFTDIYVGWPGRTHDARVLANSPLYKMAEDQDGYLFSCEKSLTVNGVEIPVHLIGDPAYPLKKWLMKGFTSYPHLAQEQRNFNHRLSSARMVVEDAFGRLKGRWRCLLKRNDLDIELMPDIVAACCILHNAKRTINHPAIPKRNGKNGHRRGKRSSTVRPPVMVEPVGFVEAWKAQFPESDPPKMELNSVGSIEQELERCKASIRLLEVEVNKERFRMIYLQTLLAKERKSYDRQRWGFRRVSQMSERGDPTLPQQPPHAQEQALGDWAKPRPTPTRKHSYHSEVEPPGAPEVHLHRESGEGDGASPSKQRGGVPCSSRRPPDAEPTALDPSPKERPGMGLGVAALRSNFERIKRANSHSGGEGRPPYASVEHHHERSLARTSDRDRDISDRVGAQAVPMERKRSLHSLPGNLAAVASAPMAGDLLRKPAVHRGRSAEVHCGHEDPPERERFPRANGGGGKQQQPPPPWQPSDFPPYTSVYAGGEGGGLAWARRAYSPGSVEDGGGVGGGYTPDCSSNENLTSSEEDFSSGQSSRVSPSVPSAPFRTSGGSFRDNEKSRSPSQNSHQSLDSSSPPTPQGQRRHRGAPQEASGRKPAHAWPSDGDRASRDNSYHGDLDGPLSGTPPPYSCYDADRAEEQRRHQDMMPYIDDSPCSSPRLSSRSRSSRDTLSSGSLESAKSAELDVEKGLEMRKWVLSGILASEETYLSHLEALLLPMKPLKAAATTSQPVLSLPQIDTIFYKVPELYEVHKEFYDGLLPRVQQWSHHQRVGELFHKLASQLGLYRAFVDNYKVAVETAEKCCQANAQFAEISENLKVRPTKDCKDQPTKTSLETLLYKPVDRVTRSTLVLHDLLKHTPSSHPDHALLQDALRISQSFLCSINEEIKPRRQATTVKKGENRQLLKDSFMVELVEGARKLRHIFLFTDLLLCAKLKKQTAGKSQQYDSKWYIPLPDLTFQAGEESDATPIPQVPDEEIDALKAKISHIKAEIQREKGTSKGVKALERMKRKLSEQESLLLLSSPNMALRVHNRTGKSYMFLISSDYERAEWKEIIWEQQQKCFKSIRLSSLELQMLTSSCVKLQTVHQIPLTINKEDSESPGLYGSLNVIVHSASGLKQSLNLYCALEVDSFGYFTNKAKTRVYRYTTEPNWNEEFEIELEGSQVLRLLCYEKSYSRTKLNKEDGESTDRIMAKGLIQLDPQTLQGKDWQRTVIAMNGIEVKISMKFTSRELSPKRRWSQKQTGVFGIKISAVTKRERSKVPYIVRQCLEEIERRGLEEVGIYRVSGVATDIQILKAAFDANNKDVSVMMSEMDVNAIAGTLKLYFRELPEPLFTDDLYSNFAGGIALADSVAKESCMLNLLLSLPEPNLLTFLFLLDHLKRVAEKESINKMSLHNLATVFGPTLLRPSEKDSKIPTNPTQALSMSDSWSLEVMSQVQVLLYFLQLETIPTPDSKRQSILFSTEV